MKGAELGQVEKDLALLLWGVTAGFPLGWSFMFLVGA